AIESACFRRFLKDGHFVAEARQLVGGAVAGGTRSNDGDFLAVGCPGFNHVEIALDLFIGSASVVAGRQLVSVHRSDRTPVAGGEQVLPLFLRWRRCDASERDREPVGDSCAFGRHGILPYAATGFSGMMCNSSSAIWNAFWFAIMGAIVS